MKFETINAKQFGFIFPMPFGYAHRPFRPMNTLNALEIGFLEKFLKKHFCCDIIHSKCFNYTLRLTC
jgi:hypothetical protein